VAGEGITAVVSLVAVSLSLAAVVTVNRRRANTASDRRLASHRVLAELQYGDWPNLPAGMRLARNLEQGEVAAEQDGRAGTGQDRTHDRAGK
jgi:hypothetical protein